MPIHRQKRFFCVAGTGSVLLTLLMTAVSWPPSIQATVAKEFVYLPLALQQNITLSSADWLAYVNHYRGSAGVPAVGDDSLLSDNCFQHSRYMAENNHLTHDQNPSFPWASPAGQVCAGNGNAWMGSEFATPYWEPAHSIDGWMESVGHRLWLLYPTTLIFGYGFYTATNNRAGAALDVLSRADFNGDSGYASWPVRYPAPEQTGIPATKYPITINWRYFGPIPGLSSTSLTIASGAPIAHTADTALPVGHKGIQILPSVPLPANTTIVVSVAGTYDGAPFSYSWRFSTGSAAGRSPEQRLPTDWAIERILSEKAEP